MRKLFVPLALLLSVSAMAQQNKDAVKFSQTITASDLKAKLSVLAGPEMEGRETATAGQRKAAAYIENHFKQLGLLPGTPQGYQQQYPVFIDSLSKVAFAVNSNRFNFGENFSISASTLTDTLAKFNEIVLVGYGITDSLYDDYKDLDVKGKCILIAEGEPKSDDGTYIISGTKRPSRASSPFSKIANAKKHGAALVLFYQTTFRKTTNRKGNMYTAARAGGGANTVVIDSTVAETIIAGLPKDLNEMIKSGHSLSTTFKATIDVEVKKEVLKLQSSNVVAILPGTDKKEEYVFLTGHYDHLGIQNGQIYYGADDDGSGTTSVLQMAQAFAAAKAAGKGPRRSIVFMTVSGEEKGLLGSEYYTSHPTVDLKKVSVDLNTDMVGRIDPTYKGDSTNYVFVIGEDKLSSDLIKVSDSINKNYMHMELDRRYNDPKDPNRFYYRSDHFNFAKNGVPVIFYFNGTHADYHKPTDTVDKINFDLMEKRVKLVFYTAWEMANRDAMMVRDIPLN